MDEIQIGDHGTRNRMTGGLRGLAWVLRIAALSAVATLVLIGSARAALVEGTDDSDLMFGADDDNQQNPIVQPPGAPNQSLNNTDVMEGKAGNDVMIGLLGGDTMLGGPGADVMVGGTEQGTAPNSDIAFGGEGNDVFIW